MRPQWYFNTVNAGLHVMNKKVLEQTISMPKVDLDRQILKPLAGTGKMFVYNSPEYVEDMGTPERYAKVQKSFQRGLSTPGIWPINRKRFFWIGMGPLIDM